MEISSNNSMNDVSLFDNATKKMYLMQFWIYIVLIIPSILCSSLGLYYLLSDRALRSGLHNHVIILINILTLVIELTDISLYIHYFRTYETITLSSQFRFIWAYLDWTLFLLHFMLYAWVTIERQFLIFHSFLFTTRKKRIFLHYSPPIVICIYCFTYYGVVFFGIQCENNFDDRTQPVIYPCGLKNGNLALYDILMHSIFPTLTIVFSSLTLLCRVLWKRYFIRRYINWSQHRKLTIQVLSISFVYLILSFPYLFMILLYVCGLPSYIGAGFLTYAVYGVYYTIFLFPMFSLASLSELRKKMKGLMQPRQRGRVAPVTDTALRQAIQNRIDRQ